MNVLVAIDSFKMSMTSLEAGNACKEGIKKADKKNKVVVSPLADGGEGTLEVLTYANKGEFISKIVTGPMGKKVNAKYGFSQKKKLAIIEMCQASGISLVEKDKRNPLFATTYGVGELIKDALKLGAKNFIIGIGGSATMDGGVGMLNALGFDFLDKNNKPIKLGAIGLKDLDHIETKNHLKELDSCSFLVASDVAIPLCGEKGTAKNFGEQKGADEKMINDIDNYLNHYGEISEKLFKKKLRNVKGVGAAGGLGFALYAFLNAKMESGISIVLKETKLEDKIKKADIVVTGEGRLDKQTIMGKAPIGVAKLAKKHHKIVIGIAAVTNNDTYVINNHGIDAYFSFLHTIITYEDSLKKENSYQNMKEESEQIFRLIKVIKDE